MVLEMREDNIQNEENTPWLARFGMTGAEKELFRNVNLGPEPQFLVTTW